MNKELLSKIKHGKVYKRQKQGRVTQEKYRDAVWAWGMGLEKPKPTRSWIRLETWRLTRRASMDTSAAKRRSGKTQAHCWMRQGTWWQRIWKRLRCLMLPSPQPLPVRTIFRNPRPLAPVGMSGVRKIYPQGYSIWLWYI